MKKIFFLLVILALVFSQYSKSKQLSKEVFKAIEYSDFEALDSLVDISAIDSCYNESTKKSGTYLIICIKIDTFKSLKYFVRRGADLEERYLGNTPLMYAVKYDRLEMVKYLLNNGADLEAKYRGISTIGFASKYKRKEIKNYLETILTN